MTTPWNASPVTEQIADTELELSRWLKKESNMLSVIGNDGGFEDNFDSAALNTTNFPYSSGVTLFGNGYARMLGGSSDGYNSLDRYLWSKLCSNSNNPYYAFDSGRVVIKFKKVSNLYNQFKVGYTADKGDSRTIFSAYVIVTTDASNNLYLDCRLGARANISIADFQLGDEVCFIFDILKGDSSQNYNSAQFSYSLDDMQTIIQTKSAGPAYGYIGIDCYYHDKPIDIAFFAVYGYPTEASAELPTTEAYTVSLPAKLAKVLTIQPHISTAGNGGVINLRVQHKSDEDAVWKNLADEPNEWTDLGVVDGSAITVSDYLSRRNDNFRFKLVYAGDGLHSYPEIDHITWTWASDVIAPASPIILTAIAPNSQSILIQYDTLPIDAYARILDVNINGAGSLPLSKRNKIESGHGHLKLVGNQLRDELSGEHNSDLITINNLNENDVVQITSYHIDNVGNTSAGIETSLVIEGSGNAPNAPEVKNLSTNSPIQYYGKEGVGVTYKLDNLMDNLINVYDDDGVLIGTHFQKLLTTDTTSIVLKPKKSGTYPIRSVAIKVDLDQTLVSESSILLNFINLKNEITEPSPEPRSELAYLDLNFWFYKGTEESLVAKEMLEDITAGTGGYNTWDDFQESNFLPDVFSSSTIFKLLYTDNLMSPEIIDIHHHSKNLQPSDFNKLPRTLQFKLDAYYILKSLWVITEVGTGTATTILIDENNEYPLLEILRDSKKFTYQTDASIIALPMDEATFLTTYVDTYDSQTVLNKMMIVELYYLHYNLQDDFVLYTDLLTLMGTIETIANNKIYHLMSLLYGYVIINKVMKKKILDITTNGYAPDYWSNS